MSTEKIFTEEQVVGFIKATITETIAGVMDWIKKETDIIDTKTSMVIKNSAIDLKIGKRKEATKYIYPRLKKHGIKIKTL